MSQFLENVGQSLLNTGGGLLSTLISRNAQDRINERNIRYQREVNRRNEELMREGWSRDDTAVQRRAADMQAAGFSPLLAAGNAAGTSTPVAGQSGRAEHTEEKLQMDLDLLGKRQLQQQIKSIVAQRDREDLLAKSEMALKGADVELKNKMAEQISKALDYLPEMHMATLSNLYSQAASANAAARDHSASAYAQEWDNLVNEYSGTRSTDPRPVSEREINLFGAYKYKNRNYRYGLGGKDELYSPYNRRSQGGSALELNAYQRDLAKNAILKMYNATRK